MTESSSSTSTPTLKQSNLYAFKEWAQVCDALARGEQTIILRRGGIAEKRGGFSFEGHERFFLLPTLYHQPEHTLRMPDARRGLPEDFPSLAEDATSPGPEGAYRLRLFARVDFSEVLTDWERVAALEPYHLWQRETIRERFAWKGGQQISLAIVRVYRLSEAFVVPDGPEFSGCRSWVELPVRADSVSLEGAAPAIADAEYEARRAAILQAIGSA